MNKTLLVGALSVVSTFAVADNLTKTCQNYLTAMDSYIKITSKDATMKDFQGLLKTKYAESKKKFATMPAAQQDAECKAGLDNVELGIQLYKDNQANMNKYIHNRK